LHYVNRGGLRRAHGGFKARISTAPPSRRLGLHNTPTATPFLPVQHPLTALPEPGRTTSYLGHPAYFFYAPKPQYWRLFGGKTVHERLRMQARQRAASNQRCRSVYSAAKPLTFPI